MSESIRRLSQRVEELEARLSNPWRDISLAPKDGTRVLAQCKWDGMAVVRWVESKQKWVGFPGSFFMEPTHFQPLPEPPEGR